MRTINVALRLTERDLLLLGDVYRFGALLRDQVRCLHFGSCDLRRCNRRLRALVQAGYLTAQVLPLGPVSRMSVGDTLASGGQFLYRVTAQAAPIVAQRFGTDAQVIRQRIRLGTPAYLAHCLEVAQVACHLLHRPVGCGWDGLAASDFRAEAECTHAYEHRDREGDGVWRAEVVKPDAYALLTLGGAALPAFWEVDLGHTSAAEWAKKISIYDRYQATGLFQSRYGRRDFMVLALTTGAERARHLCQVAAECKGASVPLYFALLTAFAEQGPLAPIWTVPGQGEPVSLRRVLERSLP